MRLWKIENGIPSLADNVLISGVPPLGIAGVVATLSSSLEFFESRGLSSYYGYVTTILGSGILGGLWLFFFSRNEKRILPDLLQVRRIWASGLSLVLSFIAGLLVTDLFKTDFVLTQIMSALGCTLLYSLVIVWARHRPGQATHTTIIIALSLSLLGLIAKFLLLIL